MAPASLLLWREDQGADAAIKPRAKAACIADSRWRTTHTELVLRGHGQSMTIGPDAEAMQDHGTLSLLPAL
jgi:hypothetical protein